MATDEDVRRGVIDVANAMLAPLDAPIRWETIRMNEKSIVLRGEGLIAKYHRPLEAEPPRNDVRALEHVNRWYPGLAPTVVAAVSTGDMVIMEDVGSGPSLADALLGSDTAEALAVLDDYIDAVAELHERSRGSATRQPLQAVQRRALFDRAMDTLKRRPPVGVPRPAQQARAELHELFDLLCVPRQSSVLSFGDLCPDNNVRTDQGIRLVDLESAGHVHPALDLAYITMPFPTCWCSFDLPSDVRAALLGRYLERVSDTSGVDEVHLAQVLYVALAVGLIGPRAEVEERVERWDGQRLPTVRGRLLHKLDRALEDPRVVDDLPFLAQWLDDARLTMVDAWPMVGPVPLAPAFR